MGISMPLSGIVPPMVTPLSGPDALDTAGIERLIERLIAGGVSGIFVLGTTGEAPALSYKLREEIVRLTCKLVNGRVPVLVGISDTSVVESVKFGQLSAELGAAAAVTTPPYYSRVEQVDVARHARQLAAEVPMPLFLYNIPSVTKIGYDVATVRDLMQVENIVGVKDSSGSIVYVHEMVELARQRPGFSVMVGPEEMLAESVLAGANGGVNGGANMCPELYVSVYKAALAGDKAGLVELRRRVMLISNSVYTLGGGSTSYLRGVKAALEVQGIASGMPAPPMAAFSSAEMAELRSRMIKCGLVAA